MNIDTNSDGVADNWITNIASGITGNFAIDNGMQRINITNSTSTNNIHIYQAVNCAAGDIFNAKARGSCDNGTRISINIGFYNGASYISQVLGTNYTNADNQELTLENIIAPANATSIRMRLYHQIVSIGDTGSAWFTNALLTKN